MLANTFSGIGVKSEIIPSPELAQKLHKPVIRKNLKTNSILIFYRQYLGC